MLSDAHIASHARRTPGGRWRRALSNVSQAVAVVALLSGALCGSSCSRRAPAPTAQAMAIAQSPPATAPHPTATTTVVPALSAEGSTRPAPTATAAVPSPTVTEVPPSPTAAPSVAPPLPELTPIPAPTCLLTLLANVTVASEVSDVMADPEHGRLFIAEKAGYVDAFDDRSYSRVARLAGKALLALDAPNDLLFVQGIQRGEVTMVDTADLSVTAVITGGTCVAVDSAGQRVFVGWADQPEGLPEEVQVWDTRTCQRLGAIQHRGAPTYNPLRDEVYLPAGEPRLAATIVDGQSLQVTRNLELEVPPGNPAYTFAWDPFVAQLGFDSQLEVIVVAFGDGLRGEEPERQVLSARTLEPLTHAVTVLYQPEMGHLGFIVLPPEDGRVYTVQRMFLSAYYPRTINTTVWRAGTNEVIERRENMPLDLIIPGTGVGVLGRSTGEGGLWRFVDLATWEPSCSLGNLYFHRLDTQTRRLYARWGSTLTVLGY